MEQPQELQFSTTSIAYTKVLIIALITIYVLITIAVSIYISLETNADKRENTKFIFSTLFGNNVILTIGILAMLYIIFPLINDSIGLLQTSLTTGLKSGVFDSLKTVLPGLLNKLI